MSDTDDTDDTRSERRNFLVVIDDTPECRVALRFASMRAKKTGGGVVLLHVIEPPDFQHWMAVENLMREEARDEAEQLLQGLAAEVNQWSGIMPEYRIREGRKLDEIIALLGAEPSVRVLVLGASPEAEGPGPLVSRLAGQVSGSFPVPITVVPGSMTAAQIDDVS